MSKVRAKLSATDQHARKIATAIAKGRPPAFSPDLDHCLEESPHEIFAAFDGAARHMPPKGEEEALAFGYLFLLQALLEHIRYRTDRGYADAAELIARFQAEVAARAEAREVDGHMLAYVAGALHQAKIPTLPQLVAASTRHDGDDESGSLPSDVGAALDGLLQACGNDPFGLVGSLASQGAGIVRKQLRVQLLSAKARPLSATGLVRS